jgi:hypothetical protein
MNKFLIISICILLVVLYPVYASNSTNGINLQQIQNNQDIYGQINSWFTGLIQSSDPLGYISSNSGYQNFVSSVQNNNIQDEVNSLMHDQNIQSLLNSTIQNGEIQKNVNSLMQNF